MKTFWKYYTGQIQFLPEWTYNKYIIWLLHPKYVGNNKYKWLGITFNTPYSCSGQTLFMYWKNNK